MRKFYRESEEYEKYVIKLMYFSCSAVRVSLLCLLHYKLLFVCPLFYDRLHIEVFYRYITTNSVHINMLRENMKILRLNLQRFHLI